MTEVPLRKGVLAYYGGLTGRVKVKVIDVYRDPALPLCIHVRARVQSSSGPYKRGDVLSTHPAWVWQRNGLAFGPVQIEAERVLPPY